MKEAVLALELERRYTKDRILEMYLNQVYFGHGAYGVEAASRTYFGKSVSEINVREAALLAGLPRAPTTYSPFEHGEAAKRRREVVLRRLVEYGALKEPEAKRLARADLGLIPPERRRTTGQYFLEYVQQTLEARYGADMVFKGGLNVYTTLNPTHAAGRRAGAARRAQGAGGPHQGRQAGRASRGRHRDGGAPDGLRPRHGRRLRLLPQRVQPGGPGPPPAGLGLQALHLHRRRRVRPHRRPPASTTRPSPTPSAPTARPGSPRTTTASSAARRRCSRRSRNRSTW